MSRRGRLAIRGVAIGLVAVLLAATFSTPVVARSGDARSGESKSEKAKISPALLALAKANPQSKFDVIVQAAPTRKTEYKERGAAKAADEIRKKNGKVGHTLSIVGGAVGTLTGEQILDLARDDDIAYISGDDIVWSAFDPTAGAALAANPAILEVGAPTAWRQHGVTGKGIGVAILDSGIAPHADLAGRIVASVDFTGGLTVDPAAPADPGGHGTHVAGLVAGNGTASAGAYTGVAPGANLVDVRVIGPAGATTVSTLLRGMQWVLAHKSTYNIRVVNLSAGATVTASYRADPLATGVEVLTFAGLAVVVSAGNYGPHGSSITTPGNDPFVITVGAIDSGGTPDLADDALASWSSHGPTAIDGLPKPDLVAPGRKIVSLRSPGSTLDQLLPERVVAGLDPAAPAYFVLSGTSMAAPMVSGVVALMLERNPGLTPAQVKHRLTETSRALAFGDPTSTGSGLVDAVAAVIASDLAFDPPCAVSDGFATQSYALLRGQALAWRDLVFNGGVDTNGTPWSGVNWDNVTWDATTWENLDWTAFNWASVTWQDITWEDITWEDITWESTSPNVKALRGRRGWPVVN